MGKDSAIEWTNHTFNPWWGCIKVSPGCEHCYAETFANRLGHRIWGPPKTTPRRLMSEDYWKQPLEWNRDAERSGERRRVFCASMADWLEDHPMLIEPRARLLLLIHDTPHLDWLLLTKRPEGWSDRLHEVVRLTHDGGDMIASRWLDGDAPPNVIAMTSVENQEYADKRIPDLLKIPAARRGLSCEPLLGPLDLSAYLTACEWCGGSLYGNHDCYDPAGIDWLIVGGESGHGARPMHPDWARSLRDQAQAAGAAYFFKQWGEYVPKSQAPEGCVEPPVGPRGRRTLAAFEQALGDVSADRVYWRVGKKAAGRLLDGVEWDEFPNTVDTSPARVYTPNSSEQFERG